MAPDVSKILCIVHRFSSFKPGPTKPLARRCQVESVHIFSVSIFCAADGVLFFSISCNMVSRKILVIFSLRNKKEINE